MRNSACVILAAGAGKRMRSDRPKVLHEVSGRPMLDYVTASAKALGISRIITVIGHGGEEVKKQFARSCVFVWQRRQAGTADAVSKAGPALRGFKGNVLVLYGDAPLIRPETLRALLKKHERTHAHATLLSARLANPSGYGRIVRDAKGGFERICEEKDASGSERRIREINTGAGVFRWETLKAMFRRIGTNNRQGERYLTDAFRLIREDGKNVSVFETSDSAEALGINTREELTKASGIMNERTMQRLAKEGVTVIDPALTFIENGVRIGKDTVVYPFTYIEKNVRIGARCHIGPFAKIRSGSVVGNESVIGSFVEVVRSRIGKKTNVKHLTYLGDAQVGDHVNVGAGTVTANFNGQKKNRTQIGDHSFIGCDTVLIAPVKVGAHARTGAGTVVPRGKHVKAGATVVGVPAEILRAKKNHR